MAGPPYPTLFMFVFLFGCVVVLSEFTLFGVFITNLFNIATKLDPASDFTVPDKLYGLLLTTTHFFSNSVAAIEMCARLYRLLTKRDDDRKEEDYAWSPAFFCLPFFCAALDTISVVRVYIYKTGFLFQLNSGFALANSLATCLWGITVVIWLFKAGKKHKHTVTHKLKQTQGIELGSLDTKKSASVFDRYNKNVVYFPPDTTTPSYQYPAVTQNRRQGASTH